MLGCSKTDPPSGVERAQDAGVGPDGDAMRDGDDGDAGEAEADAETRFCQPVGGPCSEETIGTCCTDVCRGACIDVPLEPAWSSLGCAAADAGTAVELVATGLGYVPVRWVVTEARLFLVDRVAQAIVAFPLESCGDPVKVAEFIHPVDHLIESDGDLYAATGGNAGYRGLFRVSTTSGTVTELYAGTAAWPSADATHVYFLNAGRIMRVPKTGGSAQVVFDLVQAEPTAFGLSSWGIVAGYAYFGVREDPGGSSSIQRVPVTGGPAEVLHQSAASLWVVVGRDAAYFWEPTSLSENVGTVHRIDTAGMTTLPEGAVFPRLVDVDESYLYFYGADSAHTIYMRPIAGGSLTPYPYQEGSGGPPYDAPKTSTHAYWAKPDFVGLFHPDERYIVRLAR